VKEGLLGLWMTHLKEKERMTNPRLRNYHSISSRALSAPFLLLFNPEKKKGEDCLVPALRLSFS
jgi:hypothetical protein